MKISVVYPGSIYSAFNMSDGIARTLHRMGHEVLPFALGRAEIAKLGKSDLESCDLLILSGLEHFLTNQSFGFNVEALKELKIPKAAWYHESFFRADTAYSAFWKQLEPLVDHHFFPASYDAEYFGEEHMGAKGRCHWLPHGVDDAIFTPEPRETLKGFIGAGPIETKRIDLGFIGTMYDQRTHFVNALANHLKGLPIHIGNVMVKDMWDLDYEATAYRLASNYRQIRVFLNLPALSRVLVTKVYEVMACGTFLLTPMLPQECERDMAQFENGKHLIYYPKKHLGGLAQTIRELLEDEDRREQIAYSGAEEIKARHTLEHRMSELLGHFGMMEGRDAEAKVDDKKVEEVEGKEEAEGVHSR